jgi:hypothetical protein
VSPRFAASLLMGLSAGLVSACSDSDEGSSVETTEQTWDCLTALQSTGFTTGTPVSDARVVLVLLSDDPDLSQGERDYFADLAAALDDLPDSATLGSSLDGVECPLG